MNKYINKLFIYLFIYLFKSLLRLPNSYIITIICSQEVARKSQEKHYLIVISIFRKYPLAGGRGYLE